MLHQHLQVLHRLLPLLLEDELELDELEDELVELDDELEVELDELVELVLLDDELELELEEELELPPSSFEPEPFSKAVNTVSVE